jgi:xylulokinase
VPDTWYQMGVILAATDCLNWLARTLGQGAAELAGRLPEQIDGPSSILFLPYLSGERTPYNDSAIRATFAGISIGDGPEALTRAVMEGVSFALRDCLDALHATGARPESLLALGGGTQSPFWVETLATVLGLPLDVPEKGEFGAALGAARLAMAADLGGSPAELMARPQISHTVEPRADLAASYAEAHARYRALYPNLKAVLT